MAIYSVAQQYFINELRSLLTMRYIPASGSSYNLDSVLGDDELWQDLRLGLNFFNTLPPNITTYNLTQIYSANASQLARTDTTVTEPESESLQSILITPLIMSGVFFTGLRLQWFEAGKHFSYNDNGISIVRDKQQNYANIINGSVLNYISNSLQVTKKMLAFKSTKMKGAFSGTIGMPRSLTRGARGTRMGFR